MGAGRARAPAQERQSLGELASGRYNRPRKVRLRIQKIRKRDAAE